MAENKTKPTTVSVSEFLKGVENDVRRQDAVKIIAMMKRISGLEPQMWGPSIIGFGSTHYKYESGREGDMPRIGFSPRKANLVLYLMMSDRAQDYLARLGKHKTGASCLYINKLADVDMSVLEAMTVEAWKRSS